MLEVLILLFVVAGAGGYGYWDYCRSFDYTRGLIVKVRDAIGLEKDVAVKAEREVQAAAKKIALLREAAASMQANQEVAIKKSQESALLSERFEEVAVQMLRGGFKEDAETAVTAQIEALKRAKIYKDSADDYERVADALLKNLADQEVEFDRFKTEAETLVIKAESARAKRQMYQLVSDVDSQTGLSSRARIERETEKANHENIKADKLLEMIAKGAPGQRKLLANLEVKEAMQKLENRLALPEVCGEAELMPAETDIVMSASASGD